MNTVIPDTDPMSNETPTSKHGLSIPALLYVLFAVNGIIALALVMIFSRFYGVSLVCIQSILVLTAISLTVLATQQILTILTEQNAGFGNSRNATEWGSLGKVLSKNWRVIRDGISDSSDASLSERFANSFGIACLFAGSVVSLSCEGAMSWPKLSPLTDLLGSMLLAAILWYLSNVPVSLAQIFSVWKNSFGSIYRAVSKSPGIGLSLVLAWNLFTVAYGIIPCVRFVMANDLPLVPTFFVLSVVPTILYSLGLGVFLTPSLVAIDDGTSASSSS